MSASPLRKPDRQDDAEAPAIRPAGTPLLPFAGPAPDASPVASQAQALAVQVAGRLAVLSAGSLLHARPPSVAGIWASHREAAQQFNAGAIRWPRYAWGAAHTAASGTAYLLIAVASSPAGFAVAVALAAACWLWLF